MANPITTARETLARARANLDAALDSLEQAKKTLGEAQRRQEDTSDEEDEVVRLAGELPGFRVAEKNARTALNDLIAAWVPLTTTIQADLARLPADSPVVFFPIRVETRFGRDATNNNRPALFVRIYPDEIFLNVHETSLTREEHQAAIEYYNTVNQTVHDGQFDELPAWRQIVQLMSPERAAYVLRRMAPDTGEGGEVTFSNYNAPLPSLNFPTDITFKSAQLTRPGEGILPDRWVVLATRGGLTKPPALGKPIPEPLMMTPDPSADPATLVPVPGTNGRLRIDPRMLWTVDYQAAVGAGMAVTVELTDADATLGFDRLIVFGVKTSMGAVATSAHIEQLMDAHHYTRGLAVVPQGTPTNNTEGAPTPLAQKERDPEVTFQIERERPPTNHHKAVWMLAFDRDDGDRLARALGISNGTFLDVEGARAPGKQMNDNYPADGHGPARENMRAMAMNDALWPVLFGHFTQQMLRWTLQQQADARAYFVNLVRARGPVPAFRVGNVPYGVLPALSVVRWGKRTSPGMNDTRQDLEQQMIDPLRRLREKWKLAAHTGTARIKRQSADPGADLMRVLALQPSARQMRVRTTRGQLMHYHQAQLFSFDYQTTANRVAEIVGGVLQGAGVSSWVGLPVSSLIFEPLVSRFLAPLVAPAVQLNGTAPLSGPYDCLTPLINLASTTALIDDTVLPPGNVKTMLYKMLRHALLLDMIDVMVRTTRAIQVAGTPPLTVPFPIPFLVLELLAIRAGSQNIATAADALNSVVPEIVNNITNNQPPPGAPQLSVGNFLLTQYPNAIFNHQIRMFKQHLGVFQKTPAAEVERLFTETMDLASHRLDAWLTALATRRVFELRGTHMTSEGTVGDYLGGYALLEDLRPVTRTTEPLPDGTTGEIQQGNGGFIQAPSMSHAAAAGLLRNGHLTNSTEAGQKCAVDLSSARVRAAMLVVDELRAGQTLGAILGYRFERRLHDLNAGLDAYRFTLRNRFPLVANKQETSTEPVPALAATNVVDGLLLWNAFKAGSLVLGAPDLTTGQVPLVRKELENLGNLLDGVADLTTSEAILQLVRGNVSGGAASLDALVGGGVQPEPEMPESVLRGRSLTYRVGVLVQDAVAAANWPPPPPEMNPPPAPTAPAPISPRAAVDPVLDRWLAAQLGDPTNVRCTVDVQVTNVAPNGQVETVVVEKTIHLGQLRFRQFALQGVQVVGSDVSATGSTDDDRALRPLDVVALARAVAESNQGSVLDRWIARASVSVPNERVVKINYGRVGTDGRTFPELMELAQNLGELMAGARPLEPTDLVGPGELPAEQEALAQALEDGAAALDAAADAAVLEAGKARWVLLQAREGSGDPRTALENAAAFVSSAYPPPDPSVEQATALLDAVIAEIDRRREEATRASGITGSNPRTVVKRALFKLRAIFGSDFVALPSFEPAGGAELEESFASIATGLAGEPAPLHRAPVKLLQQMAQVRESMGRWRRTSLYLRATGATPPRLDVAQLPHVPEERRIGLPFKEEGQPPPERGRVSALLHSYGAAAPDPGQAWAGLLLDEWTEVLPNREEETGVALHYDAPGAEAPQVVLVVPPSSPATALDNWQAADIIATLNETLDLAKIRTVDPEMVDVGHLTPTILVPQNVRRPVAVTSWLGELAQAIAGTRS